VDVVAQLEELAAANRQKLNWKVSIVDLLKLLDIDTCRRNSGADDHRRRCRAAGLRPVHENGRVACAARPFSIAGR
jgi:hypothetical protein